MIGILVVVVGVVLLCILDRRAVTGYRPKGSPVNPIPPGQRPMDAVRIVKYEQTFIVKDRPPRPAPMAKGTK